MSWGWGSSGRRDAPHQGSSSEATRCVGCEVAAAPVPPARAPRTVSLVAIPARHAQLGGRWDAQGGVRAALCRPALRVSESSRRTGRGKVPQVDGGASLGAQRQAWHRGGVWGEPRRLRFHGVRTVRLPSRSHTGPSAFHGPWNHISKGAAELPGPRLRSQSDS